MSASPSDSPAIDPDNQGIDSVRGSATVAVSGSAGGLRVATAAGSPAQVSVDATGKIRTEVVMRGKGGALFSLAGPAAVGSVSGDHVVVLLPATGILLDTTQGNVCTVTYSQASETGLAGSAKCDAETGSQRYTVTIDFLLR